MKKGKLEKYIRSADMGDNASNNFVNYGVKKKSEGKYKIMRLLMLLAYAAFAIAYCAFFLSVIKAPMLIALLPVFVWIISFFTWRFVSIEYEYIILDGEMRMYEVYGAKNMRELCRVRVSAMSRIAPNGKETEQYKPEECIYGVSSMSNPDVYFGAFKDENGSDRVLFFEATEKTLKVIKYYNSEALVMSKTTH